MSAKNPTRRKIVIAVSVLFGIGAVLALVVVIIVLKRRPTEPPPEVLVIVRQNGATAETNERTIAEVLEQQLSSVADIRELRSESTKSGVTVRCTFEGEKGVHQLVAVSRVREAVEATQKRLPRTADPPVVTSGGSQWGNLVFVSAKEPIREKLEKISGVSSIDVCGEARYAQAREYARIWIDFNKLQAYGLDTEDVSEALIATHPMRMISAKERDPEVLGTTEIRTQPSSILLRDVALISIEKRKSPCIGFLPDGSRAFFYKLRVDPRLEKTALEEIKAAAAAAAAAGDERALVTDREAVRVRVLFAPGPKGEEKAKMLTDLMHRLSALSSNPLTLHSAHLMTTGGGGGGSENGSGQDWADLIFAKGAKSGVVTRATVDQLRTIVSQKPGLMWGGASAQKDVKRIEVVLRGPDLDALEREATDLKKELEKTKGVIALVRDGVATLHTPQTRVTVDEKRAKDLNLRPTSVESAVRLMLNEEGIELLTDVDLRVDHPGLETLQSAKLKSTPLTALAKIEQTLAPTTILHLNRERAIALEWEVEEEALKSISKQIESKSQSSSLHESHLPY